MHTVELVHGICRSITINTMAINMLMIEAAMALLQIRSPNMSSSLSRKKQIAKGRSRAFEKRDLSVIDAENSSALYAAIIIAKTCNS